LESICDDQNILEENLRLKISSPDYLGQDPDEAIHDFKKRLSFYEKSYEPVSSHEEDLSYIKFINVGKEIVTKNVYGYLPNLIANFLFKFNINDTKSIWISRHGESMDNSLGLLGGNSDLTDRGKLFARALEKFVTLNESMNNCPIFTSTLKRTIQTAKGLESTHRIFRFRSLDELYAGECEGMTYHEIEEKLVEDFKERKKDKLTYRYPMGESYVDLIIRVHPVALDLERERRTILVISHQALLRTILGYFIHAPLSQIPYLEIPLHSVIQLKRSNIGCEEIVYTFDLDKFASGEEMFWSTQTTVHRLCDIV